MLKKAVDESSSIFDFLFFNFVLLHIYAIYILLNEWISTILLIILRYYFKIILKINIIILFFLEGNRRVFQLLPRHLRRRTMSHNLHRIPSRYRAGN